MDSLFSRSRPLSSAGRGLRHLAARTCSFFCVRRPLPSRLFGTSFNQQTPPFLIGRLIFFGCLLREGNQPCDPRGYRLLGYAHPFFVVLQTVGKPRSEHLSLFATFRTLDWACLARSRFCEAGLRTCSFRCPKRDTPPTYKISKASRSNNTPDERKNLRIPRENPFLFPGKCE